MPNKAQQHPVAFGLVVASTLVFLLFYQFRLFFLLEWFNFSPFEMGAGGTRFGDMGNQWWRFVTPTLIHFSWMHLVFNGLWLWEFGRRIEARIGSINLLGLFFVAAIFSNSVQFFVAGPSLFGGMSGVVYGFMGFIWSSSLLRRGWIEPLPPAIFAFMLIWLLLGLTGALSLFGMGAVANGAHLGGLIIGTLIGGAFGLLARAGSY